MSECEDRSNKCHVAVLAGGRTAEHEISLMSGKAVATAFDGTAFRVTPVVIEKNGRWRFPPACDFEGGVTVAAGDGISELLHRSVAVAFPAMHGPDGEDGNIQGLLEMLDVPYVGSDVYASSLCMDKVRCKQVFQALGIPTPPSMVVERTGRENWEGLVRDILERFELPVVLKTPRLGSSVGVAIPRTDSDLLRRLQDIFRYGDHILVEQYIEGRELTCPVLEYGPAAPAQALPLVEIIPQTAEFFDYEAKYTPGATNEVCPAPVANDVRQAAQQLGLHVHEAVGCRGLSRVDMMLDAGGQLHVLEVNTMPGMTPVSLYPRAAAQAGMDLGQLVAHLVRIAVDHTAAKLKTRRQTLDRR